MTSVLDEARADVAAAQASIRNLGARIDLQGSEIAEAKARIASTQASLMFAQADAARYHDLMNAGAGTVQKAQQTEALRAKTSG